MEVKFIPGLSPAGYAAELRKDLGLSGRVDPFDIAEKLEVPVCLEDLEQIDGCLLKKAGNLKILINKNIPYNTRQRFTLAHELGHLRIKRHNQEMYTCLPSDIQRYRGAKQVELEANEFASELLLPEVDVKAIIKKRNLCMDLIVDVSEQYDLSLTATAIKVIKHCPERGAVVLSENGRVKWYVKSQGFGYEVRDTVLHENTYAYDFFKDGTLPSTPQKVLASAWVKKIHDPNELLIEESVAIYSLGMVLTLIYVEDSEEWDDEM